MSREIAPRGSHPYWWWLYLKIPWLLQLLCPECLHLLLNLLCLLRDLEVWLDCLYWCLPETLSVDLWILSPKLNWFLLWYCCCSWSVGSSWRKLTRHIKCSSSPWAHLISKWWTYNCTLTWWWRNALSKCLIPLVWRQLLAFSWSVFSHLSTNATAVSSRVYRALSSREHQFLSWSLRWEHILCGKLEPSTWPKIACSLLYMLFWLVMVTLWLYSEFKLSERESCISITVKSPYNSFQEAIIWVYTGLNKEPTVW